VDLVDNPPTSSTEMKRNSSLLDRSITKEDLIQPQEIEIKELLGTGNFGSVYRGIWFGSQVALKMLKNQQKSFLGEVMLLKSLTHPNVVRFLGVVQKNSEFYIVLEYMHKGSLDRLLQMEKR